MRDQNPMDNVRFYHKSDPNVAVKVRKDQVNHFKIIISSPVISTRWTDRLKRTPHMVCIGIDLLAILRTNVDRTIFHHYL